MNIGGSFPGGKAAGAWSWPFTSIWCWGQERWSYTFTHSYVFMANWLIKEAQGQLYLYLQPKHLDQTKITFTIFQHLKQGPKMYLITFWILPLESTPGYASSCSCCCSSS
jgi:hypothetical protein